MSGLGDTSKGGKSMTQARSSVTRSHMYVVGGERKGEDLHRACPQITGPQSGFAEGICKGVPRPDVALITISLVAMIPGWARGQESVSTSEIHEVIPELGR